MNWRAIRAIVRKDLRVVVRSRPVILPIILVPALMLVAIPVGIALGGLAASQAFPAEQIEPMLAKMPSMLRAEFAGLRPAQSFVVFMLGYFFAPMFLIVPVMVASVIAADSFAGEKERKTLEALLYTPTTDAELFVAKLLTGWCAAVAVSTVGFVLYTTAANLAALPLLGRTFLPTPTWIVLAFWVAPAFALFALGFTVLISARVRGFQEAYQLGALLVLPIVLMMVGQVTGMIWLGPGATALLGVGLWMADAVLIWAGSRAFRREKVIASA